MSIEENSLNTQSKVAVIPVLAALVALVGLVDSIYLTVEHYKGELPPCSIVQGCELVLTSAYAEIAGVPLALFGGAAYFAAFALSLLAAFGNRTMWQLFGIQVILMSAFTLWLLYLQGVVIGAFCQFCLLSAITTFTLLILFIASKFFRSK
jgi:uncharacterized membrane protein